jgi:hypothetical protein
VAAGFASVVLVACGTFVAAPCVAATVVAAGEQALRIIAKMASHETKRIFMFISISYSMFGKTLRVSIDELGSTH